MSPEEAMDRFGMFLMRRVRDHAIIEWDMIVAGKMKSAGAREMQERIKDLSADAVAVIQDVIPQIVDSTLHQLLWGLEEAEDISIDVDDVRNLNSVSDGLAGELYSSDGWLSRFSQQRIVEAD